MTHGISRGERILALGLVALVVLLGLDIADDLRHGGDLSHIFIELCAFLTAFWLLGMIGYHLIKDLRTEQTRIVGEVTRLEQERNAWRERASSALAGLATEIDRQFGEWGLSSSEKEVALLMLKGLSHKEIAHVRGTSERTIRQQAASVYGKAGLEGKHQLAAFFLEDLMLPAEVS